MRLSLLYPFWRILLNEFGDKMCGNYCVAKVCSLTISNETELIIVGGSNWRKTMFDWMKLNRQRIVAGLNIDIYWKLLWIYWDHRVQVVMTLAILFGEVLSIPKSQYFVPLTYEKYWLHIVVRFPSGCTGTYLKPFC